jgi:hypothetical protein
MHSSTRPSNALVAVVSVSLVLGMAVGIGVYFAWRAGVIPPGVNILSALALLLCPPFIMSMAITPMQDTDLGLTLLVGAIVFGNAFLYAGVSALLYFVATLIFRKDR